MAASESTFNSTSSPTPRKRTSPYRIIQITLGILITVFFVWRFSQVLAEGAYGPDTWMRFFVSGFIVGAVYAVIALGYTLVYGILFMINFAHGEVMMIGAFSGYFVFEALSLWTVGPEAVFLDAYPIISIFLAFLTGMTVSTVSGVMLERIAYRPLRGAPRLVPLISAIGASFFLQAAAQLMFGPQRRTYLNPEAIERGLGVPIMVSGKEVLMTYTGIFTIIMSILLMIGLYLLVQRTKLGRAMRAVAENKETAALMGIDVNRVIGQTFAISGALAGAAGVMWGIHNGIVYHFVGFLPGIKAFTAAVLGGIGNIPGAMVGGFVLGLVESVGPAALDLDFQLKDAIAFSILVLVLVFRPSGLLGEVLTEEKI